MIGVMMQYTLVVCPHAKFVGLTDLELKLSISEISNSEFALNHHPNGCWLNIMLSKLFKRTSTIRSLEDLGPLYHSYHLFGVQNQQLPGIFQPNQACKEPIILSYILLALAKCRTSTDTPVTFAELFCADGYYAMASRHLGISASIGIDNNRDGFFTVANKVAERLGIDNCMFIEMDVNDIETLTPLDIVANIGGLYHVENCTQFWTSLTLWHADF